MHNLLCHFNPHETVLFDDRPFLDDQGNIVHLFLTDLIFIFESYNYNVITSYLEVN